MPLGDPISSLSTAQASKKGIVHIICYYKTSYMHALLEEES